MRRFFRIMLYTVLVGYSLCLIAGTLSPFDFTTDPARLSLRPKPIEWIPFTYVCPRCTYEAKDKLLNLAMFMPFGFCLGLLLLGAGRSQRSTILRVTLSGFMFSLAIESSQFFLPSRTPFASDLLLNTLSAFYGACFAWYAARAVHCLTNCRSWPSGARSPVAPWNFRERELCASVEDRGSKIEDGRWKIDDGLLNSDAPTRQCADAPTLRRADH